jgi:SAM-dependent methyltransferase
MAEANASGKVMQRFSDEQASPAGSFQAQLEELQLKLRLHNMRKIADKHIPPGAKVLEIGCGPLDDNGASFFTRSFSTELRQDFYYCDCNPILTDSFPEIISADMRKLDAVFPEGSFDFVIGTNALDTLNGESLILAIESIKKVLHPEGKLIHALNYEPYLYMFIEESLNLDPTAIPYFNEKGSHSVFIPKGSWQHPLYAILQKLDAEERQRLWQGMLSLDKQGYFLALAKSFQGRTISSWEFFDDMLSSACIRTGVRSYVNEVVTSEELVAVPEGVNLGGRCITCGPDGVNSITDSSIPLKDAKIVLQTRVSIIH